MGGFFLYVLYIYHRMTTPDVVADYLTERASVYGGTAADMMQHTPVCLWDNPDEIMEFWENKDLSHIMPKSIYPDLANDWSNIIPEDPDINRARGAVIMTDTEVSDALIDSQVDASIIDYEMVGDSPELLDAVLEQVIA